MAAGLRQPYRREEEQEENIKMTVEADFQVQSDIIPAIPARD